jgi:hypothetical protein
LALYHSGPPIRARSVIDIARGKLHHYGIENIPRDPYSYGALRGAFQAIERRRAGSAEQRHLKSEAERLEFKYPKIFLPTYEDASETQALTVKGVHFKFRESTAEFVSDDGEERIPLNHFETRAERKWRNDSTAEIRKAEREIEKDLERKAKRERDASEDDLESGGLER